VIYELANPHDPYTFEAPTDRVAALLCMIVGGNAYGAEGEKGHTAWPVMLFADGEAVEAEFQERFGTGIKEAVEADCELLATALRSLWITGRAERVGVAAALKACPTQEARDAFVTAYEDEKRSSLTDLATRARSYADALEKQAAEA
jgi:hypothetical protein